MRYIAKSILNETVVCRSKYFAYSFLQSVDLFENEIRQINASAFSGLPKLSKLVLKANSLIIPPPLTYIRTTLTYLDMSQNNLTYIPKLYFYGCSALEVIYLSRNKLSSMPNLEFVSDGVRIISLAVNRLVDVTALYRNQYPRLRGLVLNGNNLREFCLYSRVFTPLLKKVVLSENKLTTIQLPPKYFYDTDLKLRYNPWHCDKFLVWVRQCSFARFHLTCPRSVTLDLLTCESPANLKGMSPLDVGKTCDVNTWNNLTHYLFFVVATSHQWNPPTKR